MEKNDVEREEMEEESKEILGRKMTRKTAGSQTDDDNPIDAVASIWPPP